MHIRYERHVYESEIFMTDAELELSHCLYKGRGLDIADRSAELTTQLSRTAREQTGAGHTSTMQRSGSSPVSSTGILDTLSIQS
jgi:hypothetical protein